MNLSPRVRHSYGFAALSISIANTAVMFFLLKYLVDIAGIRPAVAGSLLLVGKIWDALIDPVIGKLSDRTVSGHGARRPWIAAGAVPFALLFAALWWDLPLQGTARILATALLLMAYNTAYSMVAVPFGALTPALTRDYDERTRLNGARMAWSMVGGITAGILVPWLVGHTGSWSVAGILLSVLLVPPLLVMLRATRGLDPSGSVDAASPPLWTVFRNRAFRRTALLFVLAWSSIATLSALVPFYVQHVLGAPGLLDATFATIQLSALVAIPVVVWFSKRFQKHIAYAAAVAVWAIVLVGLSAVPTGIGYGALVIAALVGPGVAAAHVLPWSMIPDVVEADALEMGRERAGAFYGAMTFLEKATTAVALWGLGVGLDLSGYVEGAAQQSESVVRGIRFLIGPLPGGVLLVAAALAIVLPPVTREAHRKLVERLQGA